MDTNGATRAEIVIIVAGVVTVIGSFLPFWEVPLVGSTNAWGRLAFPVATLMPLFGLVMATQVAAAHFVGSLGLLTGAVMLQRGSGPIEDLNR